MKSTLLCKKLACIWFVLIVKKMHEKLSAMRRSSILTLKFGIY